MDESIEMNLNQFYQKTSFVATIRFVHFRVEKISKNYVRNVLKSAQFSKNLAQKPYIIMR